MRRGALWTPRPSFFQLPASPGFAGSSAIGFFRPRSLISCFSCSDGNAGKDGGEVKEKRLARYIDLEEGDLLVLVDDFSTAGGMIEPVRSGFSWMVQAGGGVIGYCIEDLDDGGMDLDLLQECDFRVTVPQFRLAGAPVADVVAAAYRYFVEEGNPSFVAEAYERAVGVSTAGDHWQALTEWAAVYHIYGHVDGLHGMGCALLNLGMPAEAIKSLSRYLQLRPDDPWAHRHMGCAWDILDEAEAARRHWELAVVLGERSGCDTDAAELLDRQ